MASVLCEWGLSWTQCSIVLDSRHIWDWAEQCQNRAEPVSVSNSGEPAPLSPCPDHVNWDVPLGNNGSYKSGWIYLLDMAGRETAWAAQGWILGLGGVFVFGDTERFSWLLEVWWSFSCFFKGFYFTSYEVRSVKHKFVYIEFPYYYYFLLYISICGVLFNGLYSWGKVLYLSVWTFFG